MTHIKLTYHNDHTRTVVEFCQTLEAGETFDSSTFMAAVEASDLDIKYSLTNPTKEGNN